MTSVNSEHFASINIYSFTTVKFTIKYKLVNVIQVPVRSLISIINRMLTYDKTMVQILRIRSVSDFPEKCILTRSN